MGKSVYRLISLLLAIACLASPLFAQTKRPNTPRRTRVAETPEPVPTFDSLLAANSYKVYSEVRNVGALVQSSGVTDLVDPLMKIGQPPQEFKTMLKWLNSRADQLVGARMMAAGWPARPALPTFLMAIEFASPEDAKKFYPQLSNFLPTLLPTPTPASSSATVEKPTAGIGIRSSSGTMSASEVTSAPPYHLKQTGSLVLISSTPFDLRTLRPRGSLALEEDQNFLTARSRFTSESIFVYVDLKSIENEEKERRKKWEDEEKKRVEAERANPPKVEEVQTEPEPEPAPVEESPPPPPEPEPSLSAEVRVESKSDGQTAGTATLSAMPPRDDLGPNFLSFYGMLLGGGQTKWPEALGVAVVVEGDAYVVRTLLIDGTEKNNAIPFVPLFVPGTAIAPESPSIFPADSNLFVAASIDYPQMYEKMLKTFAAFAESTRQYGRRPAVQGPPPESPFAYYEKKLGLKIKDDLMPLLGNEIALALLRKPHFGPPEIASPTPGKTEASPQRPADPVPVLAIAIKDREAVKRLIPKLVEALGFKGADLVAQTERRDSTELTSYAGFFAYAFINDFLVLSPDAAETRKVVDAYINHQTLASDTSFKNSTRWQPRQVQGQVYVAGGMVEEFTLGMVRGGVPRNDQSYELLSRLNPVIDPMTYSLSNDGGGPLHELHVPKNLLQVLLVGAGTTSTETPVQNNESMAQMMLHTIASGEATLKSEDGNYGTLDQMVAKSFISKDMFENHGYTFLVSLSANKFEAVAIPVEYGKTGRRSFFIDETGVLRGGDHGGGAATVSDDPVNW